MKSDVRKQFLHDVFVTAMEGGIGYWSTCERYHWSLDSPANHFEPDLDGFYADIIETGGGDESVNHRVDRSIITLGLALIVGGKIEHLHASYVTRITSASRLNDCGELDALDCDIIVQAGLFGDVIYG